MAGNDPIGAQVLPAVLFGANLMPIGAREEGLGAAGPLTAPLLVAGVLWVGVRRVVA